MARYNQFRWYTQGDHRTKPLRKNSPLLLRIRNGDFEYSPFFFEADDNKKLYTKMYQQFMDTSMISDTNDKKTEAHQFAKMKNVKVLKLLEKANEEETSRLYQLRKELESKFGKDLWDKCLEKQRGKGTTEDMYFWYNKQCKHKFIIK